jgi:iron complex outermembrane receptor protein
MRQDVALGISASEHRGCVNLSHSSIEDGEICFIASLVQIGFSRQHAASKNSEGSEIFMKVIKENGDLCIALAAFVLASIIVFTGVVVAEPSKVLLTGKVVDPSGLGIPGVEVTLVDSISGVSISGVTDSSGRYRLQDLPMGKYKITAAYRGFAPYSQEITIDESGSRHLDISLQIQPLKESVAILDKIMVMAPRDSVGSDTLQSLKPATSDTASLLRDIPGVSVYGAGGVSSLPAIHGLADDRLRIKLDGMDLIASCPNHMNPVLSYVDPTNVGSIKVYAGVSPVSVGGDSIGGSIVVATPAPRFTAPGQGSSLNGEAGAFYRSNGNGRGANLTATYATQSLSINYAGAAAKADNYKAGGDFKKIADTGRTGRRLPLDEVGSTAYETRNHTLGFAFKRGNHLFEATAGYQDLPYQLYPNQRMDMLSNEQIRLNLGYRGQFDWGSLEARAYHEQVDHFMDFGPDKKYFYGTLNGTTKYMGGPFTTRPGDSYDVNGMPMYTKGKTTGVSVKAEIRLTPKDQARVGLDIQRYRLDDWWPPAPDCGVGNCIGGMAPLTFLNINSGKRDRNGLFAEWERQVNNKWMTLLGLRFEHVMTDTGPVTGYNTTETPIPVDGTPLGSRTGYNTSSVGTLADFNNLNRKRDDNNIDITALARYMPDDTHALEFGFAQKTRSPNLYERYSWSRNAMALVMNNFVGDGNGYLGNPDLKPEVAHTLSVTAEWHSAGRATELKVTPYYTHVKDYVDAVQWNRSTNVIPSPAEENNFVVMKYTNQTAQLYGLDASGKMPLGKTIMGAFGLKGLLNYTRGTNTNTKDDLYNIMPLNAKLTLTHKLVGLDNGIELVMVKGKEDVSDARNEIKTPGYGLVNLRSSYSWQKIRVDFGVENLFDRNYCLPLGGAYTGQGSTMSYRPADMPWGIAVPGPGRSFYAGMAFKF